MDTIPGPRSLHRKPYAYDADMRGDENWCHIAAEAGGIVAEIGVDMSRFPSAKHLASWAGVSKGNRESAGKRPSGKPTGGDTWLKAMLGDVAWAVDGLEALSKPVGGSARD